MRLMVPYVASFAVDTSIRVANTKAKRELGWQPAYPTFRDGSQAMAAPTPAGCDQQRQVASAPLDVVEGLRARAD
jgi:hypothetical protein